jgi:paraquat-inducible protein A
VKIARVGTVSLDGWCNPIRAIYNQPVGDASLVSCPHCDLLQRLPVVLPGVSARCPRCREELRRPREDSLNRTLALTTAAAILFVVANLIPMLGIRVVGRATATTVVGGAVHLWDQGMFSVSGLVLFTAVLAPAIQISFMLAIVLGARSGKPRQWIAVLLRHNRRVQTWSMVEVMLLGVVVALVKIADYATVVPGDALFMLGALVVMLSAAQVIFDPEEVWKSIQWASEDHQLEPAQNGLGGADR